MKKCKNCCGYEACKLYVSPGESFLETGGCNAYRSKRLNPVRKVIFSVKRLAKKMKRGEEG